MKDRSAHTAINLDTAYDRAVSVTNSVQLTVFALATLAFAAFFATGSETLLLTGAGTALAALSLFFVRAAIRTVSLTSVYYLLRR